MKTNQKILKNVATNCSNKIINAPYNLEYFAKPFQHIVIDNFFPKEFALECAKNFPKFSEKVWEVTNDHGIEVKNRSQWESEFDIPEALVDAVRMFNSSLFLRAISKRFSIDKLIPDNYYTGGGLNSSGRGGLLDVHIDGNYHDLMGVHRRVNLLLYLNKDWKEEWGGNLGLYDKNGKKCLKIVSPFFNRLMIFETHDLSYHGFPEPIICPKNITRNSLILYYYTAAQRRRKDIIIEKPHSALWVSNNKLDKKNQKIRSKFK